MYCSVYNSPFVAVNGQIVIQCLHVVHICCLYYADLVPNLMIIHHHRHVAEAEATMASTDDGAANATHTLPVGFSNLLFPRRLFAQ